MCEVAKSCPKLVHLDISECPKLTTFSLEQLGVNCRHLTTLKKNRFTGGYDPARKRMLPPEYSRTTSPASADEEVNILVNLMPNLKHLELRHSKLSDQGLTSLLDGCSKLEILDLTGCLNLTRRAVEEAEAKVPKLVKYKKPALSTSDNERYSHWRLYDERFQSGFFQF
jgi:F-box/leucine-rich repeat protein 2/20